MGRRWIALGEAALLANLNRERLLRLVQAGVVHGRRNLTGRWEVERASLVRHAELASRADGCPARGAAAS